MALTVYQTELKLTGRVWHLATLKWQPCSLLYPLSCCRCWFLCWSEACYCCTDKSDFFFFLLVSFHQGRGQTGPARLAAENIQLCLSWAVLTPTGLGQVTSTAQMDWAEKRLLFIKCSQLFKLLFPKCFFHCRSQHRRQAHCFSLPLFISSRLSLSFLSPALFGLNTFVSFWQGKEDHNMFSASCSIVTVGLDQSVQGTTHKFGCEGQFQFELYDSTSMISSICVSTQISRTRTSGMSFNPNKDWETFGERLCTWLILLVKQWTCCCCAAGFLTVLVIYIWIFLFLSFTCFYDFASKVISAWCSMLICRRVSTL